MDQLKQWNAPVAIPNRCQAQQKLVKRLTLSKFIYYLQTKVYPTIRIEQIQSFLHQYHTARVPVPNIIKKIWNKLKNNDQFQSLQKKYKQSDKSGEKSAFRQKLVKKLQFKKTYIQENIETAKSLQCQFTIKKILNIISQQKDVCLGCLNLLEEGKPIPKTTQLYSLAKGKFINGVLQDNIKKKTCALLNNQGGYLFVGESMKRDSVKGLSLNEAEIYQLREFVFKTIKNNIFPNTFEIKIDKLQVIMQNTQKTKSILRVALRPSGGNGLYFVKNEVLNYPSVFSCFFLDLNAVGEINDICVLEKTESIYKILLKHRSLKNTEQIVHKLDCVGRNNSMQNLFHQLNRHFPKQMNLEKIFDAGPIIKYRNQSILILSSEADDQYIPSIKRVMELKKMEFIFSKSYQFCSSNDMKSMWFISHQQNLNDLHLIIADVIANKNKAFTLITCTKYLLIEKKQKSCLKEYKKTCQQYFKKKLIIYEVLIDTPYAKQQTYDIYIKFDSFSESYFSFMFLDDHRIRSNFVKEQKFKSLNKKLLNIE